jgi:hypothetical protein
MIRSPKIRCGGPPPSESSFVGFPVRAPENAIRRTPEKATMMAEMMVRERGVWRRRSENPYVKKVAVA